MEQQQLPEPEAWQRAVYECPYCGEQVPHWPVRSATKWANCDVCDERVQFEATVTDLSRLEAVTELAVRQLRAYGVVVDATAEGTLVRCWVGERGVHCMNFTSSVDFELHEVGPREAYEGGTLDWPDEAEAFFNGYVRGLHDDWNGYAFPTHADRKHGAELREDLDTELRKLGTLAGILD